MDKGLKFHLLGRFEVFRIGHSVLPSELGRSKTQALLKVFLSDRGRIFTQEQFIELLFNGADPHKAITNLQARISELRRVLEPELKHGRQSAFIQNAGKGKYLFPLTDQCWVDIEIFQRHIFHGDQMMDQWRWAEALEHFQKADALYRGDYLIEDIYEEWTQPSRKHWKHLHGQLLVNMAQAQAQLGKYQSAVQSCQRALEGTPFVERIYRFKMLFHYLNGEKGESLKTYKLGQDLFQRELNSNLSLETRELQQRINQDDVIHLTDISDSISIPQKRVKTSQRVETLLLKSNFLVNKHTVTASHQALKYSTQAMHRAPLNPQVYASMARAHSTLAWYHQSYNANANRASHLIRHALTLDKSIPNLQILWHYIRINFLWDHQHIDEVFDQWASQFPNSGVIYHLKAWWKCTQGQLDEANRYIEFAYRLDPLNLGIAITKIWVQYISESFDEMIETCLEVLELNPNFAEGVRFLALGYERKEDMKNAVKHAKHSVLLSGGYVMDVAALAYIYGKVGDHQQSLMLIKQLREINPRSTSPYHIAVAHLANNQIQQAQALFNQARHQQTWPLLTAAYDPRIKQFSKQLVL